MSPHAKIRLLALASVASLLAACGVDEPPRPEPEAPRAVEQASRPELTIIAVGDVNLGRAVGRRIHAGQVDEPFADVREVISEADIAFANLESQLSNQNGRTEGSSNLVFTGPPAGADALARAGFDVVSTANNHAWDFGDRALRETIENLDRVGVAHAGTGHDLEQAYAPAIVERKGWKVAFIAVTTIFNTEFDESPAKNHVAWGVMDRVAASIAAARAAGAHLVLVSHHAGVEYTDAPTPESVSFGRACIDAGADAVIGHHPHVVQGVEIYRGKPLFYSLGNFLFKQNDPWTDLGLAVRLVARDGAKTLDIEYLPVGVSLKPRFLHESAGSALMERVKRLSPANP
jgi:poly-gamma-glutamate synthesis protein (capsule biosynthesis protein)